MAKKPSQRIALAQNFIKSSNLVRQLISASTITSFDTVYDIGAGRGVITAELARIARNVIAIEKDTTLVKELRRRFQGVDNIQVVEDDFLHYHVTDREYKIFANIPYNITADIIRKILHTRPMASETYLIMQKEAAEKFAGSPKETRFSILAKPWFAFRVVRGLRRTDFDPVPSVDSVLLHIHKRSPPLVECKDAALYHRFVRFGFGAWKKNLKSAFKSVFTYEQWKRLSKDYHFPLDVTPTELTFEQWLALFDCFKYRVSDEKQGYLER